LVSNYLLKMNLVKLRRLVREWHGDQKYGTEPYINHLDEVHNILTEFGYEPDMRWCANIEPYLYLHEAAYLHDVFEDTAVTPGYALSCGVNPKAVCVAMMVTDQPGANRAERKKNSYPVIASSEDAIIIKVADRLANVRRGGKLEMYRKEHPDFHAALYTKPSGKFMDHYLKLDAMWLTLNHLLR
jgi:(p)ppGpp synthase/HD superfamily hydrolase